MGEMEAVNACLPLNIYIAMVIIAMTIKILYRMNLKLKDKTRTICKKKSSYKHTHSHEEIACFQSSKSVHFIKDEKHFVCGIKLSEEERRTERTSEEKKTSAAVKRGRRRSKSARRMHMEFIRIGLRMWKNWNVDCMNVAHDACQHRV